MALTVGDVMKKDVITVEPGMNVAEMDRLFLSSRISGAPVVSDEKLVGVVSRSDVIRTLTEEKPNADALGGYYGELIHTSPSLLDYVRQASQRASEELDELRVEAIMNRELVSARIDDSVESAAETMASRGVHRVLVVDASGERLLGILSSLDLARLVGEHGLSQS